MGDAIGFSLAAWKCGWVVWGIAWLVVHARSAAARQWVQRTGNDWLLLHAIFAWPVSVVVLVFWELHRLLYKG